MTYSVVEADLTLKEDLLYPFIDAFEAERQKDPDGRCNLFSALRMDHTYVSFKETYTLWTSEERFVRFLAPFVREGRLVFKDRAGETWGYWFDGRGNVRRIEFIVRLEEGYFFQSEITPQGPDSRPLLGSGEDRKGVAILVLDMSQE